MSTRIVGLSLILACVVIPVMSSASDLAASATEIRPILIGSELPSVMVKTVDGDSVNLRDAIEGQPTVLIVYRGGWCPICNRQLSGLRHVETELETLGVRMIGVSADTPERLRETLGKHELTFTLLSDHELGAARALGIAFRVADDYVAKLEQYALDTSGNSISTQQALPVPAVFVVRPDGVITFSYVNPNYQVRCDPGVVLAAARAVARGDEETRSR